MLLKAMASSNYKESCNFLWPGKFVVHLHKNTKFSVMAK